MEEGEGGWGVKKKKQKYFNKKTSTEDDDGKVVKNDSKLEKHCKMILEDYEIPYEEQVWYELLPTHTNWEGNTVKRMKMIIDFKIVTPCGVTIWLDPKGAPTEEARMKFKFLSYKESLKGTKYIIRWAKTPFEVGRVVDEIYERFFKK